MYFHYNFFYIHTYICSQYTNVKMYNVQYVTL